jgi:hypothetical protein
MHAIGSVVRLALVGAVVAVVPLLSQQVELASKNPTTPPILQPAPPQVNRRDAKVSIQPSAAGEPEVSNEPATPLNSPTATGASSDASAPKISRSTSAVPKAMGNELEGAAETPGPLPRSSSLSQPAASSNESMPASATAALLTPAPKHEPAAGWPRSFFEHRGDVGIFAVGNFNPVTSIYIQNNPHTVISSNKSSAGGGVEYRRWLGNHNALGFVYVQNPSDTNLLWQGREYIWPVMRWDMSVLATQRLPMGRFAPFLCEGPGLVVTNGPGKGNSGWSGGFAFVAGAGTEYEFSRRLSARAGVTFLDTKGGCYGDATCHAPWGVVEDLRIGVVYKLGGEKSSSLAR